MCWLRVKIKGKGTGVRSVLSWSLEHIKREFPMCWLRVYAYLRVKIKGKGTGVRGVLSCSLDHRSNERQRVATRSHSLWPA